MRNIMLVGASDTWLKRIIKCNSRDIVKNVSRNLRRTNVKFMVFFLSNH